MTQIKLLNLPSLDNTYQNVIDFGSLSEQTNWFDNKYGRVVQGNIQEDAEQDEVVINLSFENLEPYDYLYFNDESGKRMYYFIVNKSIKTSDTCILTLECDVWNTYLFDYVLMDSFVDRCHVPRWNGNVPTVQTIDEGLSLGEIKYSSFKSIYTFKNNYIMTANLPLGVITKDTGGGGDSALRLSVLASARKLIGKPYVFGGNYPPLGTSAGTDCSGLCMWSFNDNGVVNLGPNGRWTTYSMKNHGREIAIGEVKAGDMVLSAYDGSEYQHVVMTTGRITVSQQTGAIFFECVEAANEQLGIRETTYEWSSTTMKAIRYIED